MKCRTTVREIQVKDGTDGRECFEGTRCGGEHLFVNPQAEVRVVLRPANRPKDVLCCNSS